MIKNYLTQVNNYTNPNNNVNPGVYLMNKWQLQNGPVPCNAQPVNVQNNGQAVVPAAPLPLVPAGG